jgi:hypothetical protein
MPELSNYLCPMLVDGGHDPLEGLDAGVLVATDHIV